MVTENLNKNELNEKEVTAIEKFFKTNNLIETFTAKFLDENICKEWIVESLHPEGATCPHCKEPVETKFIDNFNQRKRLKCKKCSKWFTCNTGTFLQGTRFTYQEIILISLFINFHTKGLDIKKIALILNISIDTIKHWIKKFKAIDND